MVGHELAAAGLKSVVILGCSSVLDDVVECAWCEVKNTSAYNWDSCEQAAPCAKLHCTERRFLGPNIHSYSDANIIKLEEIKPSSRVSPYIRFNQTKKLYRQALTLEDFGHSFEHENLFNSGNLILSAGTRLAIIGENGSGKTTFLRCLMGELKNQSGLIQWAQNASLGYCPQDSTTDFECEDTLFNWMSQWRNSGHGDQIVRATLGRLLFSSEDFEKKVNVCSGGERNRLLFGKIMMMEPNIILMDEPTNHMDIEAIEALNLALEHFEGTLIFVSHDREFVSSLATRIIEIKNEKLIDFKGTYDEYLSSQIKENEGIKT